MQYFYASDEAIHGPNTLDELVEMFRRGEISGDTQVTLGTHESWQPLSSIMRALAEPAPQPPPEPVPAVLAEPPRAQQSAPHFTFRDLLAKYMNQTVGLNWKEPKKYHPAKLVGITDEYFSVFVADLAFTVHYPYHQIVHVIEAEGGISTGIIFTREFPVVIETMQLIVYSGAVGVSIPL